MGMESVLFKSEEKKNKNAIAQTFRTIADKLDQGRLMLRHGSDEIEIVFPDQMVLEIKVEQEQGKRVKKSLEIELEWVVGESGSSETQIL